MFFKAYHARYVGCAVILLEHAVPVKKLFHDIIITYNPPAVKPILKYTNVKYLYRHDSGEGGYSFLEAGAFSTAITASESHLSSTASISPLSQLAEIAGSMGSLPRTLRPYPAAISSIWLSP